MAAMDRTTAAASEEPLGRGASLRAGLLAGGAALAVLLAARLLIGRPGFLERVSDGILRFIPLETFEAGLSTFGPLAKGLLYLGVVVGLLLAAALFGFLSRRVLVGRNPLLVGLVFAAEALVIAELLVLPLLGEGAGLGNALTTPDGPALHLPLLGAALAFGWLLAGLRWSAARLSVDRPAGPDGLDHPAGRDDGTPLRPSSRDSRALARRAFLGRSLALVGFASLIGSAAAAVGQVVSAASTGPSRNRPADAGGNGGSGSVGGVDRFGPTPAVIPVVDFYQVSKNLVPPRIDGAAWRLTIDGLVERPQSLSLDELRAMPAVNAFRTLECISNEIVRGDQLIGNQSWRGVPVAGLLDRAGVAPAARWVLWEAEDGYTESIPLDVARDSQTWLAYEMGGEPLPPEHGFPARVLIAGRFGMKQPKWLRHITLSETDQQGYWEQRGWDKDAIVRTMSRIDKPAAGEGVPVGRPFRVAGVANSGDRRIDRVELSPDGGHNWLSAELQPLTDPLGPLTWVRWGVDVTLARPGPARLVVRAIDGTGAVQDGTERASLPAGATGWHAVGVSARAD